MGNNYFVIENITDKDGNTKHTTRPGQYYDDWIGMTVAQVIDFRVGIPALFEYIEYNDGFPASGNMHTSTIEAITEDGNRIKLYTKNSIYILRKKV